MTRLLVSVRDDQEACDALAGGADLIDIKEPRHGPLGAATPETWSAVRTAVCERADPCQASVPLSVALGELLTRPDVISPRALQGFAFAKIGLAGCRKRDDWMDLWYHWVDELPHSCSPVAVAYADYLAVDAPDPTVILTASRATRCRTLLVDTYTKSAGDLWDWMDDNALRALITLAHSVGIQVALAGSLSLTTLPRALQLTPDWIAVRGAVCEAGRDSRITRCRVKRFAQQMSTPCSKK